MSGAIIIGLDAVQVQAGLAMQGIDQKSIPDLWGKLRLIANVAIPILNAD